MAQLIQPILDTFVALLTAAPLGELTPFADIRSAGTKFNFPYAAVEPGKTVFDLNTDQTRAQAHSITIQLGVTGSDPEELKTRVIAYVQAVDAAIAAWPWNEWPTPGVAGMNVTEVAVHSIDYSGTWVGQTGLARFADMTVILTVEELP